MRTLTRTFCLTWPLLAAWMLCSCRDKIAEPKVEAERIAKLHFEAIRQKDYPKVLADYSPEFYKTISREEWTRTLTTTAAQCGDFVSYVVDGGNLTYWAGISSQGKKPGATVELRCMVKYTKLATKETFTLFKGFADSHMQIIGHSIAEDPVSRKPDAK